MINAENDIKTVSSSKNELYQTLSKYYTENNIMVGLFKNHYTMKYREL
jgi:phosphatidate phosphatase APP1